jgi:tripeptide aminopeptidase
MKELQQKVLDKFINLVKIDSISLQEKNLFDFLLKEINNYPVEKKLQEYTVEEIGAISYNLVVKIPSNTTKKTIPIFFDAHVDTVEPGRNIKPVVDGNIIRSSGDTILAADDKSAVAAMLVAIEEITKENFPHGDIYFLFTSAEEIGLVGVQHLDFSDIRAKFGFILDSHDKVGKIIVGAPYHFRYEIKVKGKASHAGIAPEKGINAIKIAASIVTRLPQGKINRNTVANVGMIEGGKATNIVADDCIITGEFRSHKLEEINRIKGKIEEIVEKNRKYAVDIEVNFKELYKGFQFRRNDEIIKFASKAIRKLGIKPEYEKTGGGSNTNIYNQNGILSITLSTGMQNPHSTEEFIEIEDLEHLTRLIIILSQLTA